MAVYSQLLSRVHSELRHENWLSANPKSASIARAAPRGSLRALSISESRWASRAACWAAA